MGEILPPIDTGPDILFTVAALALFVLVLVTVWRAARAWVIQHDVRLRRRPPRL